LDSDDGEENEMSEPFIAQCKQSNDYAARMLARLWIAALAAVLGRASVSNGVYGAARGRIYGCSRTFPFFCLFFSCKTGESI
jgi:hypothetical protein